MPSLIWMIWMISSIRFEEGLICAMVFLMGCVIRRPSGRTIGGRKLPQRSILLHSFAPWSDDEAENRPKLSTLGPLFTFHFSL